MEKTLQEKKEEQLKETWIKNVMKVYNLTREEAEKQYNRIVKGC